MYFLDTYALIELALGSKNYDHYIDADVVTLHVNLAELYYSLLKKYDQRTADFFHRQFLPFAVDFSSDIVPLAMLFRHQQRRQKKKFSHIDCLGYHFALKNEHLFVTGDRAFEHLENVEIVR